MKGVISILLCVVCSSSLNAQVLAQDWASYFSGQLTTVDAVKYDPIENCIYILGHTADDTGVATVGAHKDDFGDVEPPGFPFDVLFWKSDLFLAKFSVEGTLIWSTYIGGTEKETTGELALDFLGNIYVTGTTRSWGGIATSGAHMEYKTVDSGNARFLMKFSPSGNLQWGTYYAEDHLNDFTLYGSVIAVDSNNNVYLGGTTHSDEGVATEGTFQSSKIGSIDSSDVFVVKFDSTGTRLWGTYIGTIGNEIIQSLSLNANGDLIVSGTSTGAGLGTVGTYQPEYPGFYSSFLMSLDSNNGTRNWGTYIAPSSLSHAIEGGSIVSDNWGNIYMYGHVFGPAEGVATEGTHQDTFGGDSTIFA